MEKKLKKVKKASNVLNLLPSVRKNEILMQMSEAILSNQKQIIKENKKDLLHAKENGLSSALIDRLKLDEKRIKDMAESIKNIASQDEVVGEILESKTLDNGLRLDKVSVPIGVIAIIYESRPNVTSDSAALCFKSSNACVLKGGKEAYNSNKIIAKILRNILAKNDLPKEIISFFKGDREDVKELLKQDKYIDLIIPRGGENLVRFITQSSSIPVIKHDKGLCHAFVDESADFNKALKIVINAKCQRTGVCNAIETLLVHEKIAKEFLPLVKKAFDEQKTTLKGCKKTLHVISAQKATKEDWDSEYLDNIISIKVIKDVNEAIKHISKHGSLHSESIISEDDKNIELFLNSIDASCVYVNASTRFTDGGVFGLGAEIGISTNKLHARGPVGAKHLVTYKYKIYGNGQIRQ